MAIRLKSKWVGHLVGNARAGARQHAPFCLKGGAPDDARCVGVMVNPDWKPLLHHRSLTSVAAWRKRAARHANRG